MRYCGVPVGRELLRLVVNQDLGCCQSKWLVEEYWENYQTKRWNVTAERIEAYYVMK